MLEEISTEETFSATVYPNPSTGENLNLRISASDDVPVKVRIIDTMGRQLYASSFEGNDLQQEISITPSLADGIYTVLINHGRKSVVERIVVKH